MQIKISVGELIEYSMRSGDINAVFLSSKRLSDGTKAHQRFQKQTKENYEEEVPIELETEYEGVPILLSGRIDGIVYQEDGGIMVDEIKSTSRGIDQIEAGQRIHWAQVRIYAFMVCKKFGLGEILTRLTYIELESFQIKQFVEKNTSKELELFFEEVIRKYIIWAKKQQAYSERSKESIRTMKFPFQTYRKGQKVLMSTVYKTIEEKKLLFSRAPTGIGKTIATLFPAIKGLGLHKCDKIFYLTAKTIGKEVACDTLRVLEEKGLYLKRVVITAKDKICLNDKKACNPEECPYAKGHYDRINGALENIYDHHNHFDRALIEEYAKEYRVCPYELSLDLALFSDLVICDYNYVFDPSAVLKRFFQENVGKYVLLIDEAHNLIDRAREMYSGVLDKQTILSLKKKVKDLDARLYKYFTLLNKLFIQKRKVCGEQDKSAYWEKELPEECIELLRGIIYRTEKIFPKKKNWAHMEDLLEFYFDGYNLIKKAELYDENYVTYYEKKGQDLKMKMFCINPRKNIRSVIQGMQGVIYFSATLLPLSYFVQILGGDEESYGLSLPSPFDRDNLLLLVDPFISTKYKDRKAAIAPIIERIHHVVKAKKGNYMVFFPSYQYMEKVYADYCIKYEEKEIKTMIQERGISEEEKEEFLGAFDASRENTLVAFVVLGGMFGEGIDLIGDRLSGAIIISVGLPQISYERNLIRDYFENTCGSGFANAYAYPGMNKVMQSAGRVIRSPEDRGIIVLIDERFNRRFYKDMFPMEWTNPRILKRNESIIDLIGEFY